MNEFFSSLWDPVTYWFWAAVCGVLGLFIGSFLNVAIYRMPMGLSVNNPRWSFCYRCGTMIRFRDNIPVLSWLLLRGRCHACGSKYGSRYMMVEILTGALFFAVFIAGNPPGSPAFQFSTLWHLAFTALLVVATFTDIDHWIIPDEVTLGGAAAAVAAALAAGFLDKMPLLAQFGPFPMLRTQWEEEPLSLIFSVLAGPESWQLEGLVVQWWEPLANALLGGAVAAAVLWSIGYVAKVILGKEAMGMGDVKLYLLIGATLGLTGSLVSLMLACFIGAGIGGGMRVWDWIRKPPESILAQYAAPAAEGAEPVLADRIAALARTGPKARQYHHLPFGPSIAMAAWLELVAHEYIHAIPSRLSAFVFSIL